MMTLGAVVVMVFTHFDELLVFYIMNVKRLTFYIMRLIWYWIISAIMVFPKALAKLPLPITFFKEMVAAHAIGAGTQAYREKNYKEALRILNPVADYCIDDVYVASAQYIVGLLYYHGLGVGENFDKAILYFSKAAEQKNEEAANILSKIGKEK